LTDEIGAEHVYPSVRLAVEAFERTTVAGPRDQT
jgi:hypothetical protein